MHGHHAYVIGESAESRLLLTITELSARVSCMRDPLERTRLRDDRNAAQRTTQPDRKAARGDGRTD